jgi:hypothetical protein
MSSCPKGLRAERPTFTAPWRWNGYTVFAERQPLEPHVVELLGRAAARAVEPLTVPDMVGGGQVFTIFAGDELRAAFVLEIVTESSGQALNCTAAAAAPGAPPGALDALLAYGHDQAQRLGARVLTFSTVRPGLARVMTRQGFEAAAGFEYRKELAHG